MASAHKDTPISGRPGARRLIAEDVRRIVGRVRDDRVTAILATGATAAKVTEAFTWLTSNEYLGGGLQCPLNGVVAAVYEILKPDWPDAAEEYPPSA
jgi:hypothetical protein